MVSIKSGITGGIVATVVAGAMMLMNNAIHRLPDPGIGQMLAALLGVPSHVVVGWLVFIVLGVFIFGLAFALLAHRIPIQSYLIKGLVFGLACWLLMMMVVMPLAGAGVFAMNRGHIVAAIDLVLNLVYWVVLSLVYRWAIGNAAVPARVRA